jgi:ribosome-associated translation inhibitor RaiA
MDADIRITDVGEAGELRRYARRRLGPIVRNPRSGIEGVSLSVNKVPGRGPAGIRCQILVRVSPRLSLSVERSEVSAHAAIDAATDRLGWALGVWHGQI